MFKGNLLLRMYTAISIILLVPLLGFGIYSAHREKEYNLLAKADELNKIATLIERRISQDFADVLARGNGIHLSEEEQVLILNRSFQPIIDELAAVYPDHGIGIASRDLIRRIAMSPGLTLEALTQPALQNQSFKVYKFGEPDVFQVKSRNWEDKSTLVVTYPVFQKGKLVGHTWANTKLEDINRMYMQSVTSWLLFSLLLWLALILAIGFLFHRFNSSIERLACQIAKEDDERKSLADFPQLLPVLDTVINLRSDYWGEVKKLKRLIDACPVAMVVVDNNGVITAYNEMYASIAKLYLREDQNLLGLPLKQVPMAAGVPATDVVFPRILAGESNVEGHQKLVGKEWLVRGMPLTDEETGEITGAVISLTDITERENLLREMGRLERLKVIGEMAASVAHEIRNPMTVVRGNLQIMAMKAENKDRYNLLIGELDRSNDIIEDFLSLARNRTVPKALCSLNKIVSRLHPLLYADAVKNGCVLELDLATELPDLLISEKEVRQLILNLWRNANDSMLSNGRLILRTQRGKEFVDLQVQDTGCGIPVDCVNKVIEPFYTTKSNGTGLGLAICQSIADQHDANLKIESSEGVGTTITIRFPLPHRETLIDQVG